VLRCVVAAYPGLSSQGALSR